MSVCFCWRSFRYLAPSTSPGRSLCGCWLSQWDCHISMSDILAEPSPNPRVERRRRPTPHARRLTPFEPLLLSIVYIFLITQFDPATSAINRIIPQSRLNWFFIASSALIFVAFGAFLLEHFGLRGGATSHFALPTSHSGPGVGGKGNLEP